MPDLAGMAGSSAAEVLAAEPLIPVRIWRAPADIDDALIVLLVDEEADEQLTQPVEEVRRWAARGDALPALEDEGLLAYSADGEPWLVAWWRPSGNPAGGGGSYSPPIPQSDVSGLVAALAAKQPLDSDLTALAALTTSAYGRGLLELANAAAVRSYIGAQASGSYQPLDSDLTALAALTTTAFGRSLLEQADAAAVRALIGAQASGSYQPLDADLTALAALTTTAYGRGILEMADAAAARAYILSAAGIALAGISPQADTMPYFTGASSAARTGLSAFMRTLLDDADAATARATLGAQDAGSYQPLDTELSALAGLTSAADRLPYFSGAGAASLATFTAAGRALVDDADAAAQRSTLGLAIGTNVQAWDADLDAIAALATVAFGRSLLTQADAKTARATLAAQGNTGRSRWGPSLQGPTIAGTAVANQLVYIEIPIEESVTLSGISGMSQGAATGNFRVALYALAGGAALASSPSAACVGNNARLVGTFSAAVAVDPGRFILAIIFSGAQAYATGYPAERRGAFAAGSFTIPSLTPSFTDASGTNVAPLLATF